jgi:hypothetical protein
MNTDDIPAPESNEEVLVKEKPVDKVKTTKVLVIIGLIFSIAVMIIVKVQNPDFPFKYIIIIFAFLLVISIILFFGFDALKKYKDVLSIKTKEKKLPPVASEEVLINKVSTILSSPVYQNHIKQILNVKKEIIGRNNIYDFEILPLHSEKTKNDVIHIIINAHYIDELHTVLYNPSRYEIIRAMNKCSTSPEPDADIERRRETDLLTGRQVMYEKKTHLGKYKRKPEKTTEDLA